MANDLNVLDPVFHDTELPAFDCRTSGPHPFEPILPSKHVASTAVHVNVILGQQMPQLRDIRFNISAAERLNGTSQLSLAGRFLGQWCAERIKRED